MSCSTGRPVQKIQAERLATADYRLITIDRHPPKWASEFYLLQLRGKLKDKNFWWKKSDTDSQEFVVDSGARVDQEVACPVARAQAREQMAQKMSERLFSAVKGKAFDTFLKGKGLSIMMDGFKSHLGQANVVGTYEEGRVFPENSQMKGQEVFHCALLLKVSNKSLNEIVGKIKKEIQRDYFHLPNLEKELEPLVFPLPLL
jgi:hypothetical protein